MRSTAWKHSRPVVLAVTLTAAALTLPGSALAQQQSTQGQNEMQPRTMSELAQERLQRLHADLHITQTESQQWDQFARTMMQNAEQMDQAYRQRADQLSQMNAVQTMQTYAQIQAQEAQGMERLVPAFEQLYASFTPEQRQYADDMFRNRAERSQTRHGTSSR